MLGVDAVKRLGQALTTAAEQGKVKDCLKVLDELEKGVEPTEAFLKATKIGVLVNKVGRQPEGDERVSRAAKTLVKEWKLRLHKDPSIDKKAIELAASAGLPSAASDASSAASPSHDSPPVVDQEVPIEFEVMANLQPLGSKRPAPSLVESARSKPLPIPTKTVRHRKRSPPSDGSGGDKATPPPSKRVKTEPARAQQKGAEPAARTHKTDKVDLSAVFMATVNCPQKQFKTRVTACQALYDALAHGSDAAVDRLVELALDIEVAMWRKAEHDKGAGKAQQAYTQHVRSLYQHIRSDKTPWVRQQLLDNELIPEQLVEMTPSQFKTTEQRELDEAIQKQAMKEACFSTRSIEEEMRTTVMWRGGGSYVAKSTPPSTSSGLVSTSVPSATSTSGTTSVLSAGVAPLASPSTSRLAQSFLQEGDGELSSVFGSVLSPRDSWQCAACTEKFRQEEVIYPHPDAKHDTTKSEVFFCRQCFADRFRKGNCKKCKHAVLSDAPFVKHDGNLWHQECYACSYCSDPATEPVIDFAGMPSCEACFDAEAYKTCGIPPSPHLGQSEFFQSAPILPAPSKWGRPSLATSPVSSSSAANKSVWSSRAGAAIDATPKPGTQSTKLSRLQLERDNSPIAPSLNELGDKLQRVGLQGSPWRKPAVDTAQRSHPALNAPTMSTRRPLPTIPSVATDSPTAASTSRSTSPTKPSFVRQQHAPPSTPAAKPAPVRSPESRTTCTVCSAPLGDDEVVELASDGTRMHSACFCCGGCGEQLGSGRFIETEARWWHHACAPAPKRYRSIVTSLKEEPRGEAEEQEVEPVEPDADDAGCASCTRALGYSRCITVPRTGKMYHEACFRCAACTRVFKGGSGEKGFVEGKDGLPYHADCVPVSRVTPSSPQDGAPTSSSLPTSRSIRSLPDSHALPPKYTIPSSPTKAVEPSLFSRRPRPPAGLGGLLICAGCSVRATDKETVAANAGSAKMGSCGARRAGR
ncbi:hypothetical protein BMF94_4924 [Rhodotorula taiwanensis]|uniref:Uncharacterized protein n=1 Tax=Rhodotorula taiwanensis TaxID=741276 RepID=A0A2S5B5J6_9BASI|nr:hypothetical protein BMF94_4924 [Rhodotorula taiwanensis]